MARFIGVDPGATGGIAIIADSAGGTRVELIPMPDTPQDIWNTLPHYDEAMFHCHAVLEKVQGYIGPGKGGQGRQPGSSMFKFGASYGRLQMALTAAGISFVEVTPQKWQRGLGIVPKKKDESKHQFKVRLKEFAQKLFPHLPITLLTADALLIAEYCRRTTK